MHLETISYSPDHSLQTITLHHNPNAPQDSHWIILIHGGAWRDPTQTATNYLLPVTKRLLELPLAGIASISYRLSAHPSHPQDAATTPAHDLRAALHPDHLHDVQRALVFLQHTYRFRERYVLVGHSCGATLAFQSVMGRFGGRREYALPRAILGVAGIYDLRRLRDMHRGVSAYQEFIEGAFGADETLWDAVSPAVVEGEDGVDGGWEQGRLAVLAHSVEDGLVDMGQRETMRLALRRWEAQGSVEVLDLKGEHDEAWEKGDELARAIVFTLAKLQGLESA